MKYQKNLKLWLSTLLLIGLFGQEAVAQVTLSDFKVNGATSVTVYTNGAPAITHTYTVVVKRLRYSGYETDLNVYAVNNNGDIAYRIRDSYASTRNWFPDVDGYDYCAISGSLTLDDVSTGYGSYGALQVSTTFSPVYKSNTVRIVRSNSPPINPPPSVKPSLVSLSPGGGEVGTSVTLFGSGMGNVTQVTFNGVPATIVGTSSEAYVTVLVPFGATTGSVVATNPRGSSNGMVFTVLADCSGRGPNICKSQNVPYTTVPALLTGQTPSEPNYPPARYIGLVLRWEYSYSGNSNDWHTVDGVEGQNFQPWDCWQTVYYRRIVLTKAKNMWGQVYHNVHDISNTVTIIPYVSVTPGVYKIRNRNTGQVLEIGGGGTATITDGTRANQSPYVGTANQEWNVTAASTGVYKISNRNSGQALEIGGSSWDLVQPGSVANQWSYWGGKNQQWLFQPVYGTANFTITNANSGQVLEIGGGASVNAQPGAVANQWPYAGKDFYEQHWELVPVNVPTSTRFPGVYTIRNVNSGKVLEIKGAATNNGATANQLSYTGTANQQWTLMEAGNGRFKIRNRNSGLALEISGSSTAYTAPAQQGNSSNSLNQQWTVEEVTPNVFKIINGNSKQALEIAYALTSDGAAATQYPYAPIAHHHWILTQVGQNRMAAPSTTGTNQQLKAAWLSATDADHEPEAAPKLSVYPNPASTVLNLSLSGTSKFALVKISDMRGVIISTVRDQGGSQIDISSLAAGVYVVTVSDGKREYDQRFIKK